MLVTGGKKKVDRWGRRGYNENGGERWMPQGERSLIAAKNARYTGLVKPSGTEAKETKRISAALYATIITNAYQSLSKNPH